MLNSCPQPFSCGTMFSMWTDEPMPEEVGQQTLTYAYDVHADYCKYRATAIFVIRCSLNTDHDYIYKYHGGYINDTCSSAFCGMN